MKLMQVKKTPDDLKVKKYCKMFIAIITTFSKQNAILYKRLFQQTVISMLYTTQENHYCSTAPIPRLRTKEVCLM